MSGTADPWGAVVAFDPPASPPAGGSGDGGDPWAAVVDFGPAPRTTAQEAGRQVGLTARSAGRGLAGLLDIPNTLLNLPATIANEVGSRIAPNFRRQEYSTNTVRGLADRGMDAVGLPRPQGGVENTVGAGVEAVTQTGPFSLAAAAPNALMRFLGVRTGGEVVLNALAGMGGHLGAQAAPEGYEAVGGMVGGLVGGGVPAAAMAGARAGTNTLSRYAQPFTRSGQETIAANRLAGAATDLPAVRERLANGPVEIVPGSAPTTAQQTGDMGLLGLERGVATRNPEQFGARRADQNMARQDAIQGLETAGDPAAAQTLFRTQLRQIEDAGAAEVATARGAADEIDTGLGGRGTPEAYGADLRGAAAGAEDAARQSEGALWDAVDPNGTLPVAATGLRQAAADILAEQTPSARPLSATEQQIFGAAGAYGDAIPFRELVQLRQNVTAAMREELRGAGRTPTYARLSRFRGAIEDSMATAVPEEAAQALGAASAATRQRVETFGRGPVGDVLRQGETRGTYRVPDSAVPARIFRPGPGGAEAVRAFRAAAGDEQAMATLGDYAAMSLRRAATRNGRLDPERVAAWQRQHADALREFPDLNARFSDAATAETAIADAMTRQRQALDEFQATAAARIAGIAVEDIPRAVGTLFGNAQTVTQLRALRSRIGNDANALAGTRRAIVQHIQGRFVGNAEAGATGLGAMRADQFQSFIRQNQAGLREFFTEGELRSMNAVALDLQQAARSQNAVRLPGGSNTAQDTLAAQSGDGNNLLQRLMRRGGTATVGATVGATVAGPFGGLVGGAAGTGLDALRAAGLQRADDLLTAAMLDPAVARLLLTKVTPQNEARLVEGLLVRLTRFATLGAIQGQAP